MRDEFKPSALPYLCLKAGISKAVPLGRAGSFYLEKLMGFTKLDEGILQSSIMAEDSDTFKVWITLLATCKEDGIAHCSAVFLSSICRLPQERINEILDKLEKPDPDSRSTTKKGCRLKRVNGGYEIINYFKYRESALRRSEAERKRLYRQQLRKSKRPDMSGQCPDSSASASASDNKDLKYLRRTKNKKETKGVVNGGTQKITLILDEEPKRWEGITPELKALWAKSYPGCDIDTVLQEMIAYWDAQPKAKRKINWKVTIVNRLKWLQDHGGTRGGVTGGVMEWLAKEKEKEKLNE